MKSPGELIGEVVGVIGSASVTIGKIRGYDWAGFVEEGKRFVRVRGWPQNPAAFGLTSSSLVPGTPSTSTTYSTELSRPPRFNPPTTGNYSGNLPPDPYADSRIFLAWRFAC